MASEKTIRYVSLTAAGFGLVQSLLWIVLEIVFVLIYSDTINSDKIIFLNKVDEDSSDGFIVTPKNYNYVCYTYLATSIFWLAASIYLLCAYIKALKKSQNQVLSMVWWSVITILITLLDVALAVCLMIDLKNNWSDIKSADLLSIYFEFIALSLKGLVFLVVNAVFSGLLIRYAFSLSGDVGNGSNSDLIKAYDSNDSELPTWMTKDKNELKQYKNFPSNSAAVSVIDDLFEDINVDDILTPDDAENEITTFNTVRSKSSDKIATIGRSAGQRTLPRNISSPVVPPKPAPKPVTNFDNWTKPATNRNQIQTKNESEILYAQVEKNWVKNGGQWRSSPEYDRPYVEKRDPNPNYVNRLNRTNLESFQNSQNFSIEQPNHRENYDANRRQNVPNNYDQQPQRQRLDSYRSNFSNTYNVEAKNYNLSHEQLPQMQGFTPRYPNNSNNQYRNRSPEYSRSSSTPNLNNMSHPEPPVYIPPPDYSPVGGRKLKPALKQVSRYAAD